MDFAYSSVAIPSVHTPRQRPPHMRRNLSRSAPRWWATEHAISRDSRGILRKVWCQFDPPAKIPPPLRLPVASDSPFQEPVYCCLILKITHPTQDNTWWKHMYGSKCAQYDSYFKI